MTHLGLLAVFAVAQIALGLYIGRRVTTTGDFFVAGRRLGGPAAVRRPCSRRTSAPDRRSARRATATATASRPGGGSDPRRSGPSSSALWVGPRDPPPRGRARSARPSATFSSGATTARVRALIIGAALDRLAGDPRRPARWRSRRLLQGVAGWPRRIGCVVGGVGRDDLLHRRRPAVDRLWVNVVQLTVKLAGFAIALPFAFAAVGGYSMAWCSTPTADRIGASGAAVRRAGSTSRCSGRRSSSRRASCRRSTARATIAPCGSASGSTPLRCSSSRFVPVAARHDRARACIPALANRELALPMLLIHDVPLCVGALGLAGRCSPPRSAPPTPCCSC